MGFITLAEGEPSGDQMLTTVNELVESYDKYPENLRPVVDNLIWKLFLKCGQYAQFNVTNEIEFTQPRLLVGRGSFGSVYQGTFRRQIRVAVKILDKLPLDTLEELRSTPQNFKSFLREIKMWRSIRPHPNVLPFVGYYFKKLSDTDNVPVEFGLVSPYASGSSLDRWLQARDERLDRVLYKIVLQFATGLRHLHEHNPPIIHGDFRAANIFMLDSVAVVADFGIAKAFDIAASTFTLQSRERPLMNSSWLAQELVENPRAPRTPSTDIFAFGCTVLEVFTRKLPSVPAQRPPRLASGTHDDLWCLLQECWSKTPEDRPTAHDIVTRITGMQALFAHADDEKEDQDDPDFFAT